MRRRSATPSLAAFALSLLLWPLSCCTASPTYTVIAPEVVRPNTDYPVAVSVHGLPGGGGGGGAEQDVQLTIRGRSDAGQTIEISEATTVSSDRTQVVLLRIGDLGSGQYTLTASGQRPVTFDQTQELRYVHKGYSVFIQTDKAIYRPGNAVKFRAVVVGPDLRPSVVGSIDVAVADGGGNVVRRWARAFPTLEGVFAGEVDIAEAPVLGDWNITVDVSGQEFHKSFLVAEYVLPKFGVDILLPDYGTFSQGDMTVQIDASYHYGGPVKGEATVSVFPKYKSSYLQPIFSDPYRKVIAIDGSAEFKMNVAKELQLSDDYAREIVFDVQVKEELTDRIQNNTASMLLYKHPYKLELVKTADAFKPGMPYLAYLKVANQDNTPVQDDLNEVTVRWGFTANTDDYNTTVFDIPEDGIIRLDFNPPDAVRADLLGIEATYKDLTQWFSTIPKAISPSNNYLQATLLTPKPQVGKNVRIGIRANEANQWITYLIFGRGKLAFGETLRSSREINFRADAEMSPHCRVIVYYVREQTGEVVADALDFEVDGALTNEVEIWASRRKALPKSDLTLNLKAKPNSFVGILAVDRSVRSLNSGHDINKEDVINELRSYDTAAEPSFYPWFRVIQPKEGTLYWYTGASAAREVFRESGTVVMSNGQLQRGRPSKEEVLVEHHGDNRPLGRPLPSPDAETLNPDQGPGVEYESATRPPLAGPYAFSRLPRPVDNLPKIYLKNDLPPTWLFLNATTDSDGRASIPVETPELANSTWIISGFSLHQRHGMGIAEQMQEVEVFTPFSVKVDLPHSVKLGETVAVQMAVYNYLEREIKAEVTLENPGGKGFTFGTPNPNEVEDNGKIEFFRTKSVAVKPGRGTLVSFVITPDEVGIVDLKISAKSGVGTFTKVETLNVVTEGERMHNNSAILLDLRQAGEQELNITLDVPRTAVPGSQKVYISATVDPMAPAMNNLEHLLDFPLGSGEQNMLRIIPAVIVSHYLESIGQPGGHIQETAVKLMRDGYQRQMAFKLADGSFSAFGQSDKRGSVWITALTARYLRQARSFIEVDERVIGEALEWLLSSQSGNGSFAETGRKFNERIQDDATAMTAFVVLSLLDNSHHLSRGQRNSMNRAISYIAENWRDSESSYPLALASYVLHLADHPQKDVSYQLLESKASTADGIKFWQIDLEGDSGNPWAEMPNSANVEITSYALLITLLRGQFDDAIPIVRWLLSQQNERGGFASTSDTYVALKALEEFSTRADIASRGSDINIQYTYLKTVRRMNVKSSEPTLVKRRILPQKTRDIRVRATGGGFAVVQVGYEYNLNATAAWPSFVVNPQVFRPSTANHLKVTVCAHYIEGGVSRASNAAAMEVNLPSGFTADVDSMPALRRFRNVKKVDTADGDTKVVLYFERLTRSEICPTVSAFRTHRVAAQRPASVLVYDYYDQSRHARSFYDVVPATVCDICQDDDCPDDGCPDRPTFPTFGSYAFGDNVDVHDGAASLSATAALASYLIAAILGRILVW